MESREIGRLIKELLFASNEVRQLAGENIFPFPAIEGVKYPFITYMMENMQPYYTKDRNDYQDNLSVEVMVWSDSYEQKIALCNAVHSAMQGNRGNFDGLEVSGIRRISEGETFVEDTYGQSILYEIQIDNS